MVFPESMESRTPLDSRIPDTSGSSFDKGGRWKRGGAASNSKVHINRKRDRPTASELCGSGDSTESNLFPLDEFNETEEKRKEKGRLCQFISDKVKTQTSRQPQIPMAAAKKRRKAKQKEKNQHLKMARSKQGDMPSVKCEVSTGTSLRRNNGFRDPCTLASRQDNAKHPLPLAASFMGQQPETITARSFHRKEADVTHESLCDSDSGTDEDIPQKPEPKQDQISLDLPIPRKKSRSSDAAVRRSSAGSNSTLGPDSTTATEHLETFSAYSADPSPAKTNATASEETIESGTLSITRAQPRRKPKRKGFGSTVTKKRKFRFKKIDALGENYFQQQKNPPADGLNQIFGAALSPMPKRKDCASSQSCFSLSRNKGRATTAAAQKQQYDEEILVDSPEVSSVRRSKRKSIRRKSPEVIEIEDESETEELLEQVRTCHFNLSCRLTACYQSDLSMELSRIAVGKKVFREGCRATFTPTCQLRLLFKSTSSKTRSTNKVGSERLNLSLKDESLQEIKYFNDDESIADVETGAPSTLFLSLRVMKNASNGLDKYTNAYDPQNESLAERRYLVLEFRDDETFQKLVSKMQEELPHFVNELSQLRSVSEAALFCAAFESDNEVQEKQKRRIRGKDQAKCTFLEDKEEDSVLVVYPFDGDSKAIDEAGKDLPILSCNIDSNCDIETPTEYESTQQIVILAADYERLEPEVYLNDTIIDFFCHW